MNDDGTPSNRLDSLARSIVQDLGSSASTVEEAIEDPLVSRYIQEGMAKANEVAISRATKVQVRIIMCVWGGIGSYNCVCVGGVLKGRTCVTLYYSCRLGLSPLLMHVYTCTYVCTYVVLFMLVVFIFVSVHVHVHF